MLPNELSYGLAGVAPPLRLVTLTSADVHEDVSVPPLTREFNQMQ